MRLLPSAVFRHALRVYSASQLLHSSSFHDGVASETTQSQPVKSSPPGIKLTVKHRGVNTNPDEPSLNIMAYADLSNFNDPKKSAFPIPDALPEALQSVGFIKPTPIQQHTIPMMLLGEDLIGLAPTGTGKTLAFAVPAFTRVDPNIHSCQVLVLCPTRELALQTFAVFEKISGPLGVRCAAAYGGAQNRMNQSRQCAGAQIIVATPGRLTDFAREGIINLGACGFFVLDEADRLLDMGFKPQIDDIMHFFRTNKLVPQTLMWSATWDDKIQGLAGEYIKENHFLVSTGAHETGHSVNPLIKQLVYFTDRERPPKIEVLMKLYQENVISPNDKAIIFVERKGTAAMVYEKLRHRIKAAFPSSSNMFCMAVHGDLAQRDRERAIHMFKAGPCNLLVATDVVARGIDIPNVAHVINYEMPSQFDSYVHRIGRTGRNGKSGSSHAFFETANDIALAPSLDKFLRASEQNVPSRLSQYVAQGNQILQRRQERKDFGRGRGGRSGGGRGYNSGYQRGGGYQGGGRQY